MRKFGILILTVTFLSFCIFGVYLFIDNLNLNKGIEDISRQNEEKLKKELQQQRQLIKKELDAKHRLDIAAYETMAKRLELEKNSNKELEKQLE